MVEVTVFGRRPPRLTGVIVHSTDVLERYDQGLLAGIPVTRVPRTLLDLGSVAPDLVEAAMEDALVRGLTTMTSLRRLLSRVGSHGRPGTAVLRRLLAERGSDRAPTESALEDTLVGVLRRRGVPEPVRQYPVAVGGRILRVDLAYPEAKLAIEADGRRWHTGRADFLEDRRRGNLLASVGWVLLRFGWDDVRHRPSALADEVNGLRTQRLHLAVGG